MFLLICIKTNDEHWVISYKRGFIFTPAFQAFCQVLSFETGGGDSLTQVIRTEEDRRLYKINVGAVLRWSEFWPHLKEGLGPLPSYKSDELSVKEEMLAVINSDFLRIQVFQPNQVLSQKVNTAIPLTKSQVTQYHFATPWSGTNPGLFPKSHRVTFQSSSMGAVPISSLLWRHFQCPQFSHSCNFNPSYFCFSVRTQFKFLFWPT